jgi:uncharacterized cupin superfamily protein
MQRTVVEGVRMWSVWQPDRNLFFNSFFVQGAEGEHLIVDPLPLSEADAAEIDSLGGAAWVVVTNRDHERDAQAAAKRFGAKLAASEGDAPLLSCAVDRNLKHGDEVLGNRVIGLDGLKTAGEIALNLCGRAAVIVGDALWGDPAGSVRLMPDEKLADPARAALSLRRVYAARPQHLLLGDGACVFGDAQRVLWTCLEARSDVYVNRMNVADAEWSVDPPSESAYVGAWFDIDFFIGAQKLGYRLARIPPGKTFCPLHWHTGEEELFIVTEGAATLLTPRGTWAVSKGDFVAFPTRAAGAHKVVNETDTPCEIVMISSIDKDDVCFYPDSKKVLVEKIGLIVRDNPVLDYFDGE